jgi:methyl-accepting chemotaxis protein
MTALQPLTDSQVQNRLEAYNAGGSLERDIRGLWDQAGEIIESEVRTRFGDEAAAKTRLHYTTPVDAAWIQSVAEYGRRIYREKTSVPAYIAKRDELITAMIDRLFEQFAAEPETLRKCVTSLQRITAYETDIILAQVALLEANEAADGRGQPSSEFERRVADLVK